MVDHRSLHHDATNDGSTRAKASPFHPEGPAATKAEVERHLAQDVPWAEVSGSPRRSPTGEPDRPALGRLVDVAFGARSVERCGIGLGWLLTVP